VEGQEAKSIKVNTYLNSYDIQIIDAQANTETEIMRRICKREEYHRSYAGKSCEDIGAGWTSS
jgi:hypothetical protein